MGILSVIKKAKETGIDDFRNTYVYAKIGDKISVKEDSSRFDETEFKATIEELSFQYPCKINKVGHDKSGFTALLTKV